MRRSWMGVGTGERPEGATHPAAPTLGCPPRRSPGCGCPAAAGHGWSGTREGLPGDAAITSHLSLQPLGVPIPSRDRRHTHVQDQGAPGDAVNGFVQQRCGRHEGSASTTHGVSAPHRTPSPCWVPVRDPPMAPHPAVTWQRGGRATWHHQRPGAFSVSLFAPHWVPCSSQPKPCSH